MNQQEIFYKLVGKEYQSALARGKYCKIYLPDTIVESEPDSLGCMLFSSYEYAKLFYKDISPLRVELRPFKILAVNGIGKMVIPKKVCVATSEHYFDEFYDYVSKFTKRPVEGTVCFKSVKVLYQIGSSLGLKYIKV